MYDPIYQIKQIFGVQELNQHFPIIHTMLIKLSISIGNSIFNSINIGVAIYTIMQMLLMAMTFSFTITYMAKKNVNFYVRLITLIYFAFCPTIALASITMTKDTLFSTLMLLVMIIYIELIENTEEFFKSKMKVFASIIIFVLTILFRGNAIYSFILSIPFIVMYKKNYRIKTGVFLCSSIFIVLIINFIICNVIGIPKGSKVEMYSIPLQQITRALIENEETFPEEDKEAFLKFFKKDDYKSRYRPYISDPIKENVDKKYFQEHQQELLSIWIKLLFKYPKSYVDAFLCLVSGYIDVEETRVSVWNEIYPNEFGIEKTPIYNSYLIKFTESLVYSQNIPIISLIYNLAFVVWIHMILFMFNIYKKNWNKCIVFLPLILYFLTILLGPLNNEYRYIFFLFTVLPISIEMTFSSLLINKTEESDK